MAKTNLLLTKCGVLNKSKKCIDSGFVAIIFDGKYIKYIVVNRLTSKSI
jgi:hypothetical protein